MADCYIPKMPRRVKNLAGQKLGRLTVEKFLGLRGRRKATWLCRCDCGKEKIAETSVLTRAKYPSCGCFHAEIARVKSLRHGMSHTPEHRAWLGIIKRTTNPNYHDWKHYGGRGIMMCERWRNSFEAFYADMGPQPSPIHSVDRFPDNNGNYEPKNCRWATRTEQGRNRRNNHLVVFRGEKLPISVWTERFGFRPHHIRTKLNAGWDMERISTSIEQKPLPYKKRAARAV